MTVAEIKERYLIEFTNDEPVNFCGLVIYPILLKNYYDFCIYSNVLTIEKNSTNDPKIISMQYLEYLITLCVKDEKDDDGNIFYYFYKIISMVLRKDEIDLKVRFDEKKKIYIEIEGNKINKKDFDTLRKIILCMNIPEYNDDYINPDLKADLELYNKVKNSGKNYVTFEKEMMATSVISGTSFNELLNMSIRKYFILKEMQQKILEYKINRQAEMSGFVEFKEPIPHYLEEQKKDMFNSMLDYGSFKNKIQQ